MWYWLPQSVQRIALVVLVAVALVATGFAHRLVMPSDVALEAYVLAGGDVADLCGVTGEDGTASTHRDCEACHIVASAMLPDAPESLIQADLLFVATVVAPRESRALRRVLVPGRGMRAPPLV